MHVAIESIISCGCRVLTMRGRMNGVSGMASLVLNCPRHWLFPDGVPRTTERGIFVPAEEK